MASWVVEILFPFWLHVFQAGAYTSSSISLCWDVSRGDCLGVTGCAALGGVATHGGGTTLEGSTLEGGTTLVGGTIGEITGVSSGTGLVAWRGWYRWSREVPGWVFLNRLCLSLLEDIPNTIQFAEGFFTEVGWHATFELVF